MSQANGAAASPLSLFSPNQREKLLKLVVGKHTGVLVELGGVTIDLLPFSTAEGLSVFSFVRKFADVFRKIRTQQFGNEEYAEIIGSDGEALAELKRLYLARCIGLTLVTREGGNPSGQAIELKDLVIADQPERESFELWNASLELVSTIKTLAPLVLEANGMLEMTRPPQPASADVGDLSTQSSTPSTQPATS